MEQQGKVSAIFHKRLLQDLLEGELVGEVDGELVGKVDGELVGELVGLELGEDEAQ